VTGATVQGSGAARTVVVSWQAHDGPPYFCSATDSSNATVGPVKAQKTTGCEMAVPGTGPIRVKVVQYGADYSPSPPYTTTVGS
jgi:hypothetical protein